MQNRSEAEISRAIRECVLECIRATDRLECIDQFVTRLVKERGWSQDDANEVARSAMDVIKTIEPHMADEAA
jgi:hypothetical protein